jgi:hypothetical protein
MEEEMTRILEPFSPRAAASTLALALIAAAGIGCGSSGGGSSSSTSPASGSVSSLAPIHGRYSPSIDPADFVRTIDNRYFPLKPGTGFHYAGVAENGKTPQADDMVVTDRTKQILGVDCTVVSDIVSSHGKPIEKTFDWYAQDKAGNVWYMGEDTRELHHGRFVKMSDSWEGGVGGAQPGIIMPGDPKPGDEYRQEYYPGHALDQAKVLGSGGPIKEPYGSFKRTLATEETSPKIDPGVVERKYYVAGVGDVEEHSLSGDHEHIRLLRISH